MTWSESEHLTFNLVDVNNITFTFRNCVAMLAEYVQVHKDIQLKAKKKSKVYNPHCTGPVKLAQDINDLKQLLDMTDIGLQLQHLEYVYDAKFQTKLDYNSGASSTSNIVKLWFEQAKDNRLLSRYLYILPDDSMEFAHIKLQLLQGATSNLIPMEQYLKHADIVERGIRREICRSLITIFDWCSSTGPQLAKRLLQIHHLKGYEGLEEDAPYFVKLVDHIIQHVLESFSKAIAAQKPNAKKKLKSLEPDLQNKLRLGPIHGLPSHVPFNLYGLRGEVPPHSPSVIKLKNVALPGRTLCLSSYHVYETAVDVLQEFWVHEFIMPPLRIIDNETRSRKHTSSDDNTIYHRNITRAAILSCIASACGDGGIFASNTISKFLESPASLFEEKFNRSYKFGPAVITNRDRMLAPLLEAVKNCISEDPGLIEKARLLGNIVTQKLVELHLGGPIDIDSDFDDSPQILAVLPNSFKKRTLPKSISARNFHKLPKLQGNLLDVFLTMESPRMAIPAIILREALNYRKGLSPENSILRNVLLGRHATQNSATIYNPDQTDPAQEFSLGFQLLQKHIPSHKLTSREGLSNLLSWMGTGQGFQTRDFLESIPRSSGFFASSHEEMEETFQTVINKNTKLLIDKGLQSKKSGSGIDGYINYEDMKIWGSPSNFLSATPTLVGGQKQTLNEKFKPYWAVEVQDAWVEFLGDMLDQDPSTWTAPRKGWDKTMALIASFQFPGFGGGLTLLHCTNAIALLKLVTLPEPEVLAVWISNNKNLGAYRGLQMLGFTLSPKKSQEHVQMEAEKIQVGFKCIFAHLDVHLSMVDKALLGFNVLFVEHLLCKIARWDHRMRQANLLEKWEEWINDAEKNVDGTLPIPLTMEPEKIKQIIEETLVSF
jgi:hypothetical protein